MMYGSKQKKKKIFDSTFKKVHFHFGEFCNTPYKFTCVILLIISTMCFNINGTFETCLHH